MEIGTPKRTARQRGELSLLWVAVTMALLALLGMAALVKMRYDRNIFGEMWAGLVRATGGAEALDKSSKAVDAAKGALAGGAGGESGGGALRKCMVDGKVVYSNVECKASNPTSKAVQLNDTKGFEAPKLPPPPPKEEQSGPTALDKAIEKQTR